MAQGLPALGPGPPRRGGRRAVPGPSPPGQRPSAARRSPVTQAMNWRRPRITARVNGPRIGLAGAVSAVRQVDQL